MVQLWIDVDDAVDPVALVIDEDERLRRIAVFDAAVNNTDRKAGPPAAGRRAATSTASTTGSRFSPVPEAADGALGLARRAVRGTTSWRCCGRSAPCLDDDLGRRAARACSRRSRSRRPRRRIDRLHRGRRVPAARSAAAGAALAAGLGSRRSPARPGRPAQPSSASSAISASLSTSRPGRPVAASAPSSASWSAGVRREPPSRRGSPRRPSSAGASRPRPGRHRPRRRGARPARRRGSLMNRPVRTGRAAAGDLGHLDHAAGRWSPRAAGPPATPGSRTSGCPGRCRPRPRSDRPSWRRTILRVACGGVARTSPRSRSHAARWRDAALERLGRRVATTRRPERRARASSSAQIGAGDAAARRPARGRRGRRSGRRRLAAGPLLSADPELRVRRARGQSFPDLVATRSGRLGASRTRSPGPASGDGRPGAARPGRARPALVVMPVGRRHVRGRRCDRRPAPTGRS